MAIGEEKRVNFEEIENEMNELMGGNENQIIFNIYKRWSVLHIKKLRRALLNENRNSREEMEMQKLEADLQRMQNTMEVEEPTEEKFAFWILQVSKWVGYPIRAAEITLFDFCIHTKQMTKESEAISKQIKQNERKNLRYN
jgi:hypothetical protein